MYRTFQSIHTLPSLVDLSYDQKNEVGTLWSRILCGDEAAAARSMLQITYPVWLRKKIVLEAVEKSC